MRAAVLILSLSLIGVSAAQAAGVNDQLPNGQQGGYYAQSPPSSNVTPPTPNASGQMYTRRLYRQMYRTPRVHYRYRTHR
ncbi:MAG TPA: hypothetical protein VFB45_10855 [Pseudolabrys sp.]|nr:hypothetical protein [Pseudolabrys sp.]